jgi:small-conductance mechanosensitive channel
MNSHLSSSLVPALLADLNDPGLVGQLVVLTLCLMSGWGLSRVLMNMFSAQDNKPAVISPPVASFLRVLSPLLSVLLIAIAIPVLGRWQHVGLLRVALPLLISFLLIRVVFFLLRRVFVRGGKVGTILLGFEKVFALTVWLGVALHLTGLLPEMVQYLEETTIPVGRHQESLLVILQAGLSVVVTLIVALWAGAVLEQRLMQLDSVHSSVRVVLARVARAMLILLAVLVSLSLVGLDLTVLSVFGGALGVGIGLGLQKLVSSYVSGFVILLERSLSIGDLITVDRFSGRIEQIRTRYTVLRSADGVESVIPNEMLVSIPVQNLSMAERTVRVGAKFSVPCGVEIESVLPRLQAAAVGVAGVLDQPAPLSLLLQLGPERLEFELAFWIAAQDKDNHAVILSAVNRALWRLLQPFSTLDMPKKPD